MSNIDAHEKNGHFMDIPIVLTVNEILENCE